MINWIWAFLLLFGIIVAGLEGNIEVINSAIFDGAKTGVTICFGLISILVFWLGIMKIAEKSGLLNLISRILQPIISWLFPDVPKGHPAEGYIISNMTANIFGLGNAATPMGIKAMEELQKINPHKEKASAPMATLLALNTSSITLIPTLIISIRMTYQSNNPTEIVGTCIFASLCSTIAAIFIDKFYQIKNKEIK